MLDIVMRYPLFALLAWASLSIHVDAREFRMPAEGEGNIIGALGVERASYEDTLLIIGRSNGLGLDEIRRANPDLDTWLPGKDAEVLLPTEFILPDAEREGIVVNIPEMRLYYFPQRQPGIVLTHPLGIGRQGWGTPYIRTRITEKRENPTWTPPESIRQEHAAKGKPLPPIVAAGPDNPLGSRAMRLGQPDYLLHGTNQPGGVGLRVSHGCIRLYPEDIESLFEQVSINTAVNIVNQPYKIGEREGIIYLEVHPHLIEDRGYFESRLEEIVRLLERQSTGREYELDMVAMLAVMRVANGMPQQVGFYLPFAG
ncbi:MAG: L,D-transpeptidase family protein [Candidatus Eutrophobiaceae bacterium]